MSFEKFRCMIESEDTLDEGPANCQYPKCWIGDCPHKQARDKLSEVEKLPDKWRKEEYEILPYGIPKSIPNSDKLKCADELERVIK